MAVVVTGASGFIGRHLVTRLLHDGHTVVGIDRRPAGRADTTHLRTDLTAGDRAVERALREADAVFHLAGQPGVRGSGRRVARARWRDNVMAGWHVLRATPPDVALIVTSTSAVYGGARWVHGRLRPSHEDDVLAPRGGYARSKRLLERQCGLRAASGGRVAVVRPFTVVGEGQRPDMAVARWIDAARRGDPLTVHGDAARRRDLTDVHDVVEVLVRCWVRGIATTVNAGTGHPVALTEIAAAVAAAVGVPVGTVVTHAHRDEVPDTCADTTRCRALLGMVPTTDLLDVARRQAAAHANNLEVSA